ncbi:BadF/BadG/BcrA/BcrD ATPase family protein [Pararobbsia alpina]|uniref:Glucosamine kinase GspK n=1 Tax=Pararobbsia alpina TaxID=621374 RepID=A0A6S7B1Q0_9BURK|nr:BadF/BadG/BcrA/BcrD ATPase family protein [Pararobbsia alpina]CAB3778640.1 Glucosamine kinase GspK [Pararobbsia alpina]
MSRFAIGVDGGGTGTRVLLADARGTVLARADGGPSALGLGVGRAWQEIQKAVRAAFVSATRVLDWRECTLCCGLSGVNNAEWRRTFVQAAPAGVALLLHSDAFTTLWGAHRGQSGIIVALGTGSIAATLDSKQELHMVGGYGFPSGDEASGAWLGLRALVYLQQVMDGRRAADAFSASLRAHTGAATRDELVEWSCAADQTACAGLAPIVIAYATDARAAHPFARALLEQAGDEIGRMIDALDPIETVPIALCGGLAQVLAPFVPHRFASRLRPPSQDSVSGALALALAEMGNVPDGASPENRRESGYKPHA